jgi:CBS-domain-containing membrane protein
MINISQFIRFIAVDPVNLSLKGKLLAVVSGFCAILIMALITQKLTVGTAYPIIVASMGASAVILFIIPHSPLAQPWPFLADKLYPPLSESLVPSG